MYPETAIDHFGSLQGWNDASKLHVALEYISNQGSDQAFEEFLRERVAEENGAVDTDYISLEDCIASGEHLEDCDDDGYCNRCGEQTSVEEAQAEIQRRDEKRGLYPGLEDVAN